mgnify:CR=1 FL=1
MRRTILALLTVVFGTPASARIDICNDATPRQTGRALRYAGGSARGLLHHAVGHYRSLPRRIVAQRHWSTALRIACQSWLVPRIRRITR